METLQRTANRGSISTGYDIDNSLKFEPDNSEYLGKTPTSSGNRRTFTISMWIKRTEIGIDSYLMEAGDGDFNQSDRTLIKFDATDNFRFGGGSAYQRTTNRVFRDTSAWYHIVMAVDTTNGTASNRLKLYVNGVQETSFSTSADPSQNFQYAFCKDDEHTVGFNHTDNVSYFAGYMSEVILIDGQQLAPTEFGEFDEDSGIWKPINVSGLTFGTNGFYLDFKDSANLGNDASGGTDFTEVNITAADQATDTPTNNFATLNPLNLSTGLTLTNGATKIVNATTWRTGVSTIAVTKGKWYFETKSSGNGAYTFVGFVDVEDAYVPQNSTGYFLGYAGGNQNRSVSMRGDGTIYNDNNSASGASFGSSNIVGMALDMDNRKVYWYVDNSIVNSGNAVTWATSSTLGDAWTDVITLGISFYQGITAEVNFGGYTTMSISSPASDANGYGTFEYAPPTGFYALCTKNLAEYG